MQKKAITASDFEQILLWQNVPAYLVQYGAAIAETVRYAFFGFAIELPILPQRSVSCVLTTMT